MTTALVWGGWVVGSMPRPHFTPGKDPVPIVQEAWSVRCLPIITSKLTPRSLRMLPSVRRMESTLKEAITIFRILYMRQTPIPCLPALLGLWGSVILSTRLFYINTQPTKLHYLVWFFSSIFFFNTLNFIVLDDMVHFCYKLWSTTHNGS